MIHSGTRLIILSFIEATMRLKTTSCLSARVTESSRSKQFRTIGGLALTSMVVLGCSQVSGFLSYQ